VKSVKGKEEIDAGKLNKGDDVSIALDSRTSSNTLLIAITWYFGEYTGVLPYIL